MAFIGYARVRSADQSLDRQLDELHAHGCERIFADAASGKRGAYRPLWVACLAHLRAGDTLVVVELSRIGRNTGDLGRLAAHDRVSALREGQMRGELGSVTDKAWQQICFGDPPTTR